MVYIIVPATYIRDNDRSNSTVFVGCVRDIQADSVNIFERK